MYLCIICPKNQASYGVIHFHFCTCHMRNLVIAFLLVLFTLQARAQQEAPAEKEEKLENFGYLELGGRFLAGLGGQYERLLHVSQRLSFTVGVGLGSSHPMGSGSAHWPVIIPVSGGILLGKRSHHFEFGISRLLVKREFYEDPEDGRFLWPITAYIGYRKLPQNPKGMFYKIDGLVYPVQFLGALPFIGFGLGYQF